MSKLIIKTNKRKVFVIGDFCNWSFDNSIECKRQKGYKCIFIEIPDYSEYKVCKSKDWQSQDITHIDNNRIKQPKEEVIEVEFNK